MGDVDGVPLLNMAAIEGGSVPMEGDKVEETKKDFLGMLNQ